MRFGRPALAAPSARTTRWSEPASLAFFTTLAAILVGYMFLGRGFAHIGIGPVYVGELVLAIGFVAAGVAIWKRTADLSWTPVHVVLALFMLLGLARTVPYLTTYKADAARDAVVWGYAFFGLIVYALVDRRMLLTLFRAYGFLGIAFAFWAPIAFQIFSTYSATIPVNTASNVPLLFFKNPDMAVHAAGVIAFLVVGTPVVGSVWSFLARTVVAVPISWLVFTTGAVSRGALASVFAALAALLVLKPKTRNWAPLAAGALAFVCLLTVPSMLPALAPGPGAQPSGIAAASPTSSATSSSSPGESPSPTASPSVSPSPSPTAAPTPAPTGRSVTGGQIIENVASIFGDSSNEGLQGTKSFRLAWWTAIVHYTVDGPYFWTGKGFGINLADSDGFQVTQDGSLREPHNTTISILARMGVPGAILWILLQVAFAFGLLWAVLKHRRAGDLAVAAVGVWVLAYWAAIMVDTSFDPYLEGPQGGIWFWVLFGLGLVVIKLSRRPKTV